MLAPPRDFINFAGDGAGLICRDASLELDRPLPYALPAGPLWLRPSLAPWLAARANLERLSRDGKCIVLLGAERSLDAPDAPDALRLIEHGVCFAISLAGLQGEFGRTIQRRARALLAAPGVHLLVSLAPDNPARTAAWAAFAAERHGLSPDDLTLLTESNWIRLAAGERAAPVTATPPKTGLFNRLLGRDKAKPAAAPASS